MDRNTSRREFLKASSASVVEAGAAWSLPAAFGQGSRSPNERPVFGFVGTGIRFGELLYNVLPLGPAAAICDIDASHLSWATNRLEEACQEEGVKFTAPQQYDDYRRIFDRPDIDIVVVATSDHWHTKILIEALRAGKDVYCEKPLTLTIEEGQRIQKVLQETGRVVQIGT